MAEQNHIIRRQVFDIQYDSKENAQQLQNRFSRIFNDRLTAITERVFDRHVPKHIIIRLQELNLDLGIINHETLEEELVKRYEEALEKELLRVLRLKDEYAGEAANNREPAHKTDLYARYLQYFLLTGTAPWWADADLVKDINGLFAFLAAQAPGRLKEILLETGSFDYVRKRIVYQLSEEIVKSAISLLEPYQAQFIFQYHAEVIKMNRKEPVVQADTASFSKSVWLFIITYIIQNHSGYFNRKMFVKSTLAQLGLHYNISYARVLTLFSDYLKTIKYHSSISLPSLIKDLREEQEPGGAQEPETAEKEHPASSSEKNLHLLKYYLLFGTLPAWARPVSRNQLFDLFEKLSVSTPAAVKIVLTETGRLAQVRRRMASKFNDQLISSFIRVLEPQHAGYIIGYAKDLDDIQQRKNLVKTGNENFRISKWEFILAYLLVEKSSVFEKRMFIRSFISQMAAKYNLARATLTRFLIQAVTEEFAQRADYVPLFQMLKEIADDDNAGERTIDIQKDNTTRYFKDPAIKTFADAAREYGFSGRLYEMIATHPEALDLILKFLAERGSRQLWSAKYYSAEELKKELLGGRGNSALLFELGLSASQAEELVAFVLQSIAAEEVLHDIPEVEKKRLVQYLQSTILRSLHKSPASVIQKAKRSTALKDILTYYFTHGYLPWWASSFAAYSAEELVNRFYIHSPQEAALLIKSLLSDAKTRFRVVEHLSAENITRAILAPAESGKALPAFYEFLDLLKATAASEFTYSGSIEKLLLHRLFETAAAANFSRFNIDTFTIAILNYLSADQGISMPDIHQKLIQAATQQPVSDRLYNALKKALKSAGTVQQPTPASQGEKQLKKLLLAVNPDLFKAARDSFKDLPKWVETIQKTSQGQVKGGTDNVLKNILRHFLEHNHLPEFAGTYQQADIERLLREIALYIYGREETVFKNILLQKPRSAQAVKLLREIFANPADTRENALKISLLEISENGETRKGAFKDWLNLLERKAPAGETWRPENLLATLKFVLRFFLEHNRLPDLVPREYNFDNAQLLREIILFIHEKETAALKDILGQKPQSVLARMRVHDAFTDPGNSREKAIKAVLQEFLENDTELYLATWKEETGNGPGMHSATAPQTWSRLLQNLMGSKNQLSVNFLSRALRSEALVKWIAANRSHDEIFSVIQRLNPDRSYENEALTASIMRLLSSLPADTLLQQKLIVIFLEFSLLAAGGVFNPKNNNEFTASFMQYLASQQSRFGSGVWSSLLLAVSVNWVKKDAVLKSLAPVIRAYAAPYAATTAALKEASETFEKTDKQNLDTALGQPGEMLTKAIADSLKEAEEKKREERKKILKQDLETAEDEIFVQNAGLVLLWPFFGHYFQHLGLVKDGAFINAEAAFRGAHLLQYLAWETEKNEEHALVLNKILCNIDISEAIPLEVTLTDAEKEFSQELLKVATTQWDKMKNTSPEGFRASFLQRDGLLTATAEGWRLRVELRGYDVLLQTLPWSINMIKTAWMDKILNVEWT